MQLTFEGIFEIYFGGTKFTFSNTKLDSIPGDGLIQNWARHNERMEPPRFFGYKERGNVSPDARSV